MATLNQKRVVDNILKQAENGGKISVRKAAKGIYGKDIQNNPQRITQSKGFKELLEQYLPDDVLLTALAEDIENKPRNRKAELELAFKVKGRLTNDQPGNITNILNVFEGDGRASTIARRILANRPPSEE